MTTPILDRLREWLRQRPDPSADSEELGFFLSDEPARWEYWCTPLNAVTFASTGGDGVHFSFVDLGEGYHDRSPIVMTVPMAFDDPNRIVGEHLVDFLALGATCGFFALENLAYRGTLGGVDQSETGAAVELARTFDLSPWTDISGHLQHLEARFFDRLVLPDRDALADG